MPKKDLPIKDRIRIALLNAPDKTMKRYALMRAVFPSDRYPKAFNYQCNGGPPGCAMSFGRAIRELYETGALWYLGGDVQWILNK